MGARVVVGHPVDVASGTLTNDYQDGFLVGRMPLILSRRYSSTLRPEDAGMFGPGWSNPFEMRLWRDLEGFTLRGEDGEGLVRFDGLEADLARGGVIRNLGAFQELRADGKQLVVTGWSPDDQKVVRFVFQRQAGARDWLLASRQDPSGQGVDVERDAGGRITALRQRRERRTLQFVYDRGGRVVEVRGAWGARPQAIARYAYDASGRLAQVTDAAGFSSRFEYDAQGRLIREIARNGGVWSFAYDLQGRCVQAVGQNGYDEKRLRIDEMKRVTEVTDSRGLTWKYEWNAAGQVEQVRSPMGGRTTSRFDEHGRIIEEVDPEGGAHRFEYDEAGNRCCVVDPKGARTLFEYNEHHQLVRLVDKAGHVWKRRYDAKQRLVETVNPLGHRWMLDWSEGGEGDLTLLRGPAGDRLTFGYDPQGQIIWREDSAGHRYEYGYDERGLPVFSKDALGGVVRREYDARARLVAVRWPDGASTRNEYDPSGELFRTVGRDGSVTTYRAANCSGRWMAVQGPRGTFQYGWDNEPTLLTEVRNPEGATWRFEYDEDGRLAREIAFDGLETRYEHDRAGRLVATHRAGEETRFTHDALGLITSASYADGQKVEFEYDAMGHLIAARDAQGEVRISVDAVGRAVAESVGDFEVRREFDALGRLLKRSTSLGFETRYRYDLDGCLKELELGGQPIQYHHDAMGRETRRVWPGGAELRLAYDALHRLSRQTVLPRGDTSRRSAPEPLVERRYTYDLAGRLTELQDPRWGAARYRYDEAGRLLEAAREGAPTEKLEFDRSGNLTSVRAAVLEEETAPAPVVSHDRRELALGGKVLRQGGARYEYDGHGRTLRISYEVAGREPEVWTYTWDARERLVAVQRPEGATWRYTYDALGRRLAKEGPDGTVHFRWDGERLVQEINPQGQITSWEFVHRSLTPVAKQEQGQTHFFVTDHLGAPRELVTSGGAISWAGMFSVTGALQEVAVAETECPVRYPGQWADAESGLSYNRFRYYQPSRMQFLTRDPVRQPSGPGAYDYTDNPLLYIDPLGLLAQVLYDEPDALGRPRGASALITPHDISTGTPANSSIRPPGFVHGNHPHHHQRGHLIGNQLGGDGNHPLNLVTLTAGTNHPHMEALEARVRAHVEAGSGNYVDVRVTPIYRGDNPVPTEIHYHAVDIATGQVIVNESVVNGLHKNYSGCSH